MSIVQSLLLLNALIQQLLYDRRDNDIDNEDKTASKFYFFSSLLSVSLSLEKTL